MMNNTRTSMTIESLKEDTKYLVVSFDGATINNKKSVDLIPRSWAFCHEGLWFCRYPDPKDYSNLDDWLKELKEPESEWEKYEVTVLKEAGDHEQGLRRLQRCYKDTKIVSTDDNDSGATDILPTKLSKAARKAFLHETITEDAEDSQETEDIPSSANNPENRNNLPEAPAEVDVPENRLPSADSQENPIDLPETAPEVNVSDNLMHYLDVKMQQLELKITAAIKSSKRSILYDLEKKITELKNTVIVSTGGIARGENASSSREKLGTALPIKDLDDYLAFEVDIAHDDQKKQSLKSLFAILIAGSNSWKDDVGRMLNSVITKTVQIHYSGCGRKVKGVGKRNFSETVVFACMKDVLEEHYRNTNQPMQLISRVSRWLAGAGDREGGRLERSANV